MHRRAVVLPLAALIFAITPLHAQFGTGAMLTGNGWGGIAGATLQRGAFSIGIAAPMGGVAGLPMGSAGVDLSTGLLNRVPFLFNVLGFRYGSGFVASPGPIAPSMPGALPGATLGVDMLPQPSAAMPNVPSLGRTMMANEHYRNFNQGGPPGWNPRRCPARTC